MQQFDWQGFKEGRFLARVESQKDPFFLEAKKNGIFCFMGDREKERNLYPSPEVTKAAGIPATGGE